MSGYGPMGGCGKTIAREIFWLVAKGLVFVALVVVVFVAMASNPPRDDSGTDGVVDDHCGELSARCEGNDG